MHPSHPMPAMALPLSSALKPTIEKYCRTGRPMLLLILAAPLVKKIFEQYLSEQAPKMVFFFFFWQGGKGGKPADKS